MNELAAKYKITSEEAGRKARYDFFDSIENIDKIALAHNLDDNAETVLFRIIRGQVYRELQVFQFLEIKS